MQPPFVHIRNNNFHIVLTFCASRSSLISLPLSSKISQKAGEDLRVLFLLDATCIVQDDTEVVYILSEVAGADLNLAIEVELFVLLEG